MSINHTSFESGYICAVAQILRLHGDVTMAKDVLQGVGPAKVNWNEVAPEDRFVLEKFGLAPPSPTSDATVDASHE
jgi:hypothetical protein